MSTKWQHAQKEEKVCWTWIKGKLNKPEYKKAKISYWEKILNKADLAFNDFDDKKVIETGCGPSGIFMMAGDNLDVNCDYTILDPLLDDYQQIAPQYFSEKLNKVVASMEDYEKKDDEFYDYIFAINCIDHSKDIDKFVSNLKSISNTDSRIIISINTHQRQSTADIWKKFQFILEPHHPYHFTSNEYQKLFEKHLQIQKVVDIEDEVLWVNNETKDENEEPKGIKKLVALANIEHLVEKILTLIGYPPHDFKNIGNSIYRHKMFICSIKK